MGLFNQRNIGPDPELSIHLTKGTCDDDYLYPFLEYYYDCLVTRDQNCVCEIKEEDFATRDDKRYIKVKPNAFELLMSEALLGVDKAKTDTSIETVYFPFNPALFKGVSGDQISGLPVESENILRADLQPYYYEIKNQPQMDEGDYVIIIVGEEQKLYLVREVNGQVVVHKTYDVSTSKYGYGSESGSDKTPLGIHRVFEKIGDSAPIGEIFQSQQATGEIAEITTEPVDVTEYMTTRLLVLYGMETHNKNTHSRHIYIHGTPEEGFLGSPASHGCVRMGNSDIVELYNLIEKGTYLNIVDVVAGEEIRDIFKDKDKPVFLYKLPEEEDRLMFLTADKREEVSYPDCEIGKTVFTFCAQTTNTMIQEKTIVEDNKITKIYDQDDVYVKFAVDLTKLVFPFENLRMLKTEDNAVYFVWSDPEVWEVKDIRAYFSSEPFFDVTTQGEFKDRKNAGSMRIMHIIGEKDYDDVLELASGEIDPSCFDGIGYDENLCLEFLTGTIVVEDFYETIHIYEFDNGFVLGVPVPDPGGVYLDNYIALTTVSAKNRELGFENGVNYWQLSSP
jgi:hypothetical protein